MIYYFYFEKDELMVVSDFIIIGEINVQQHSKVKEVND